MSEILLIWSHVWWKPQDTCTNRSTGTHVVLTHGSCMRTGMGKGQLSVGRFSLYATCSGSPISNLFRFGNSIMGKLSWEKNPERAGVFFISRQELVSLLSWMILQWRTYSADGNTTTALCLCSKGRPIRPLLYRCHRCLWLPSRQCASQLGVCAPHTPPRAPLPASALKTSIPLLTLPQPPPAAPLPTSTLCPLTDVEIAFRCC